MPIDIKPEMAKKSVFSELDAEIDQIWAEAVNYYRKGEKLYLSAEAERIAREEQLLHSEADERIGIIDRYLNTLLPKDWDKLDIYQRRAHFDQNDISTKGVYRRDVVCVAEIWTECLGKDKEDMNRYNTRELNDIMRSHPEWEVAKSTKKFSLYGTQKYYIRKLD
jgi:predicted P-loop ATPase